MLFKPNLACTVIKNGAYTAYGQPGPTKSYSERCAIIELVVSEIKTSVRADSSASRGAAQETVVKSKILLEASTVAEIDDVLVVSGQKLKITSKFPRHSIRGVLDHFEVTAMHWKA